MDNLLYFCFFSFIMLLDIHAHLDHHLLANKLDEVLERSKNMIVVTNGINPETNRWALDLSKKHKNIKAALGIYPITSLKKELVDFGYNLGYKDFNTEDELKWIEKIIKLQESANNHVFGIGEIGLDYFVVKDETKEQRNEQKELFIKLLKLGKKYRKPLIIHSRKAEEDVVEILEQEKPKKAILHCFCGSKKLVKRVVDSKWCFSITANLERSSQMQMIVNETPLSQLLTETDAPYLSYEKDKINEPINVKFAVEKIAKMKKILPKEAENIIFKNYQSLI